MRTVGTAKTSSFLLESLPPSINLGDFVTDALYGFLAAQQQCKM